MNAQQEKTNQGGSGLKFLLGVIIVVIVGYGLYYAYQHYYSSGNSQAAGPGRRGGTPEVSVVTVKSRKVVLTSELPGRTSAYLVAEVRPQASGIIQERLFTEGADVEAGQVLYQIDPAPFKAAVANAEANLTGARRTADRAKAAVDAGLAQVEQQKAVYELAQKERRRLENLVKGGAVSISQRDQAVTEAEVALATLRAAEAQVKSDREAVEVAEASILQTKAALETARINLGYTGITAPISGRIGMSNVTVGALVTAHQAVALATIQKIDPIYVDVPQSTASLLRMRKLFQEGLINGHDHSENKVRLVLEDGSEYPHQGILQFRDVTVDPSTGSVTLRIVFPNPEGILLPGMFVRTVVTEGVDENAILLPQQTVARDQKGNPQALAVDATGKVEVRKLKLDRAVGAEWLVASGVKPGERVIIEGLQKARPGAQVNAVPYEGEGETKNKTGNDDTSAGKSN